MATWNCDVCGKNFQGPDDPYGTVGIATCAACNGGKMMVGPILAPLVDKMLEEEKNVMNFYGPYVPNSPEWGNNPGEILDGEDAVQCESIGCGKFWSQSKLSEVNHCPDCEDKHSKALHEIQHDNGDTDGNPSNRTYPARVQILERALECYKQDWWTWEQVMGHLETFN